MSLMSRIHGYLLRRGKLVDLLPDETDLENSDRSDLEAARAEIEARAEEEKDMKQEVATAIRRLRELDKRNHYGESLRRAFGGS